MKDYHLGVVATFDDETRRWTFQATTLNGDESPFMEMQEVYNHETYEWEDAFEFTRDDELGVERANGIYLEDAVWQVQHILSGRFPLTTVQLSPWPTPDPDEALSFDECEAAGVDGTLRQIGAP